MIIQADPGCKLPPVIIEFERDNDQDIRLAKSEQHWWKMGAQPATSEIWLPVCDGIEVLIPDAAARRYIIKFMNMKAKRMLAAGYRPRLKSQLEEALIGFATPVNGNGVLQ